MNFSGALDYAASHGLQALVAMRGGEIVADAYANDFDFDTPHALYSGTKSFWGAAALCAQADGLLNVDERVACSVPAWNQDPWKRQVTLRMLLTLTAGLGFGGLGSAVPTYDRALGVTLKNAPGTAFTYGGISLQIFGAVLAIKLQDSRRTPHDYLRERVLKPAGAAVATWRTLNDGTHPLPTGAAMTPRNWLAYGQYVMRQHETFAECFTGTPQNPRYGLGWWLGAAGSPRDLVYASGSGGQALYLVPSMDLAIAHFGKSSSYKHEALLKRLFSNTSS